MGDERAFTLREAGPEDSRRCFGIFRGSLRDLMRRTGYSDSPDDADAAWPRYEDLFAHLAATSASWWLAEDEDGTPFGYARATLRGATAELSEFFVAPDARVKGAGRALLEHAFPVGWGEHRSIIATLDAPAVALYLRFGVRHQDTAVGFSGAPGRADPGPGLDVTGADLDTILELESEVLGHSRPEDIAYIAGTRPAVIASRAGKALGYAFLPDPHGRAGPIAARDPHDLPALLALVEAAAHEAGVGELDFTVPLSARTAVDWLLAERRFRVDPFYTLLLADSDWARFDRYVPFNPCVIL